MGHHFEERQDATLQASPEQVWDAIATGPGIDSWFMGRNEVEPGPAGTVRMAFGGYTPEHQVTQWSPPNRFAYRNEEGTDGRYVAYEFLIEGRDQGSTVLRMAVSGFLPGDDWETEYDAMTKGNALFFRTLVEYLSQFTGRTATPITAFGPAVQDWDHAWATLRQHLGLAHPATVGTTVQFTAPDATPIDGVVYFVNSDTLGIRADNALYRFLKGFSGPMIVGHHLFSDVDQTETEKAWESWLSRVFS